jgi:5'-3' exonuclease
MYNSNIKYPKNPYTLADIAISKYGVESHQMVDYQTLVGDKGDDVPTLLGPAKVKKILAKYGSIRNWYKKGPRGGKRWLTEHSEEILRNRKLVQLIDDCIEIDINDLKVPRLTKKVQSFPSAWHDYQSFLYPKSRGLF